jgi:poly-beta-1,6-N-acetyl-D-glucosamine biosynthesis protein PgaD
MSNVDRPWPPLIVAAHLPPLIRLRDAALTLIMWVGFAILLEKEFIQSFREYLEPFGFGAVYSNGSWAEFFDQLLPFVLIAAFLALFVGFAGLASLRQYRRSLHTPQPPRLEAAEQARRAGLDEAALVAARELPIVIVHIAKDGNCRIEPPPTAAEQAQARSQATSGT